MYESKANSTKNEKIGEFPASLFDKKWLEKEIGKKVSPRHRPLLLELHNKSLHYNNHLMFSSTSSIATNSHCRKNDSFYLAKIRITCFISNKPKLIKTSGSTESQISKNYVVFHKQSELYFFDDFQNQTNNIENGLIKSRSRALHIYSNPTQRST